MHLSGVIREFKYSLNKLSFKGTVKRRSYDSLEIKPDNSDDIFVVVLSANNSMFETLICWWRQKKGMDEIKLLSSPIIAEISKNINNLMDTDKKQNT